MIKKFEEFSKISESADLPSGNEIDAREDLSKRPHGKDLTVSTEIDPLHETHPTISVYFPEHLFMYIDLEKIDVRDYDSISSNTAIKIGEIVQELDSSIDYELRKFLETVQDKIKEAADKIQTIPAISGKRYGL